MCLLFETIKLKDGVFFNLDYHSARMNDARKSLFSSKEKINLKKVLSAPVDCRAGIFKCKVYYDHYIHKIEFTPYSVRKIRALQIVYADNISYPFKFSDRSQLDEIKSKTSADDILIIKNGLVSDTSFSNIIFFDGSRWVTPSTPLLKGTKRQEMLDKGMISEMEIKVQDLKMFMQIKLINAMLDFDSGGTIEILK